MSTARATRVLDEDVRGFSLMSSFPRTLIFVGNDALACWLHTPKGGAWAGTFQLGRSVESSRTTLAPTPPLFVVIFCPALYASTDFSGKSSKQQVL